VESDGLPPVSDQDTNVLSAAVNPNAQQQALPYEPLDEEVANQIEGQIVMGGAV
jgi:hypothetical protein